MIDYSIVIRTLGTAGEKYQALLDSISHLNIQPREVLVVLPEGYAKPDERLGYETFVYSAKGMVSQRVYGGALAKSKYILLIDDDITFPSDFIEILFYPIEKQLCEITVPKPVQLPRKHGIQKIVGTITMSAVSCKKNNGFFTRILRSGGWAYSRYNIEKSKYLYAETASGICCFCLKTAFESIHFEEELWLQDVRYPLWEDQVMYYKFWQKGYKVMCATKADIEHLDAGGNSENRAKDAAFASARNKVIFWHKYIYTKEKLSFFRLLDKACLFYHLYTNLFFLHISDLKKEKEMRTAASYRKGMKNGFIYIHENL